MIRALECLEVGAFAAILRKGQWRSSFAVASMAKASGPVKLTGPSRFGVWGFYQNGSVKPTSFLGIYPLVN